MTSLPQVKEIKLLQKLRTLTVLFDNNQQFDFSCAYLRIFSPSAEAKKHKTTSLKEKEDVNIVAIEPVGNYAIKLIFDDGHDSGIFSWQTLYELGIKQPQMIAQMNEKGE